MSTRRDFLKTMGSGAVAMSLPHWAFAGQPQKERPNVVLIMTDDQGFGDVGVHGNQQINTPHLDAFATEGVRFARSYCSPVCSPTRASLLTGRYHYRTGVIHTSRGGAKMHGDEVTIAERLRDAGYATGIFGKWHVGGNYPMRPQDQGFGESLVHKSGGIGQTPDKPNSYFDPFLWRNGKRMETQGYCTDVFTSAAIEFIEANRKRSFFVYLATNAPHTPLEIDPRYSEPYSAMGLDDTTAKVYGMVTNIDENFGRLLAKLDELGLRKNTLVIFLTDNGPQQMRYTAGLRGRKSWVYEGGIRVPCFMQWPGRFQGGREIDRIAAHIDLHPTILDACGLRPLDKPAMDGVSLLPLLEGDAAEWLDRKLFLQCHRGLTPKRYQNAAVIMQRYKMVGYPGTFGEEALEPSENPILELYDLTADPGEQNDLAGEHPEIVAELRAAYDAWFDDVRSSRGFTPGYIHIGSDAENPSRLCRYQDSTYVAGEPTTWSVYIERGSQYEFTVNRGSATGKGAMHVRINGKEIAQPLEEGANTAVFSLPAGKAELDVWTQEEGQPRVIYTDNDTVGDVDVRRLE